MAPKFGTSGLRGLVTELSPTRVANYTRAFLQSCPTNGAVHLGWDLRPSSPDIAQVVADTVKAEGVTLHVAGVLPTPALALAALKAGEAAIMITGSHIPADRNGLKFYTPSGEISKPEEQAILAALDTDPAEVPASVPQLASEGAALPAYVDRYVQGFGAGALKGLRIGVYQHSSVARDAMVQIVEALGATAVPIGRSEVFIPVDTEAVDPGSRAQFATWCADHQLDSLISTDGDADRPMLTDASGTVVLGDTLGALTAEALGATTICTPVSSNTLITQMPAFTGIRSTKIGSPYVIAAMEEVLAADPEAKVVGYEANGGFLLGFNADGPAGPLSPLMTRDCLLPMLTVLARAVELGKSVAELAADLPQRFTAANRLQGIATETSKAFIAKLTDSAEARADFFQAGGAEAALDLTDGLRVSFANGTVVHLRPSGNAPEFRCYAEAGDSETATALVETHLAKLQTLLG